MTSDGSANGQQPQAQRNRVGGFMLLNKVGQGAMGAVFKARQESVSRYVALKILPPRLAKNRAFLERFLREARAAARLSDPNIVEAIDAGEADGYYYFAMELVDGPSLGAVLKRQTRLPEARALEIARDMASALDHAHTEGIIHRDVKPANILIGKDGSAKLADLGLAREQRQVDSEVTQAGDALGTPDYISPEQVRGETDLDGRTDIYSLGATLYHMLTGTAPFLGGTSAQVMSRHLTEPVPDPRTVVPRLSLACSQIIRRSMQKDRTRRYATGADMLRDIEAALGGRAVGAPQELEPFVPIKAPGTTRIVGAAQTPAAGRLVGRPTHKMRATARSRRSYTGAIVATVVTCTAVLILVLLLVFGRSGDDRPQEHGPEALTVEAVKSEIGALEREGRYGDALARVEELRRAHVRPEDSETLKIVERDLRYAAHERYEEALQKAQLAATKRDYSQAVALLKPVLAFGIPELAEKAQAEIGRIQGRQASDQTWTRWEAIRDRAVMARSTARFEDALKILDEAAGLPIDGVAALIAKEKQAVHSAERQRLARRIAAYDAQSERLWRLFKERKYGEADRLIAKLVKDPTYTPSRAKVLADAKVAELLKEFWRGVERGVLTRKGKFISIGGASGTVRNVENGVVIIVAGEKEHRREVGRFSATQAAAYARLEFGVASRLAVGVFLIAEREDLAEAERALAGVRNGKSLEIYRDRLKKLKSGQ
jgi:tRNA A-37 threonylcarbamoyl transferase component Bud32